MLEKHEQKYNVLTSTDFGWTPESQMYSKCAGNNSGLAREYRLRGTSRDLFSFSRSRAYYLQWQIWFGYKQHLHKVHTWNCLCHFYTSTCKWCFSPHVCWMVNLFVQAAGCSKSIVSKCGYHGFLVVRRVLLWICHNASFIQANQITVYFTSYSFSLFTYKNKTLNPHTRYQLYFKKTCLTWWSNTVTVYNIDKCAMGLITDWTNHLQSEALWWPMTTGVDI